MYIGSCLNICMYLLTTRAINRPFLKKQEQNMQACTLYSGEKQELSTRAIPDLGAVTCAVYAEIRRKL